VTYEPVADEFKRTSEWMLRTEGLGFSGLFAAQELARQALGLIDSEEGELEWL
jgi:hypothetical protein